MSIWGRGRVRNISFASPEAVGTCDCCGFQYSHSDLDWQYEWQGAALQNTYMLVCPTCMDIPQEQLRAIILPPDPRPIQNPRPFMSVEAATDIRVTQGGDTRVTMNGDTRVTQG